MHPDSTVQDTMSRSLIFPKATFRFFGSKILRLRSIFFFVPTLCGGALGHVVLVVRVGTEVGGVQEVGHGGGGGALVQLVLVLYSSVCCSCLPAVFALVMWQLGVFELITLMGVAERKENRVRG